MLRGRSLEEFLANTWRRHARIFAAAIDPADYPLSSDSIYQLACDDLVESRMINTRHELILGPFEQDGDTANTAVPPDHLLLVQCLEQHLGIVDQLLSQAFSFIPRWQVDDVMASIGDTGASCGAHFDQYDVFLVQISGNKLWQLDAGGHMDDDLDDHQEIRLLRHFQPTEQCTLTPGDVLYLPPGVGHYGICQGLSVTLSVGIRNPTMSELLGDITASLIDRMSGNQVLNGDLYNADHGLTDELGAELSTAMQAMLDPVILKTWYGCYVTRLREPEVLEPVPDALLDGRSELVANLPSRFTFSSNSNAVTLFANGESYELTPADLPWIEQLCRLRRLQLPTSLGDHGRDCLQSLLRAGALR